VPETENNFFFIKIAVETKKFSWFKVDVQSVAPRYASIEQLCIDSRGKYKPVEGFEPAQVVSVWRDLIDAISNRDEQLTDVYNRFVNGLNFTYCSSVLNWVDTVVWRSCINVAICVMKLCAWYNKHVTDNNCLCQDTKCWCKAMGDWPRIRVLVVKIKTSGLIFWLAIDYYM